MHKLALIADSNEVRNQILHMFQSFQDERQRDRQDDKEAQLMQSLASDYKSDKGFVSRRINGTCEWFFEDERFINWRDINASSLLWVSAGPGCGKSVLAKALVDERRLSRNTMTTTVCYFFFKDGQEDRMHGSNALSAMLHQLFSNPNLIVHGLASHARQGSKLCTMFHDLWGILIKAANDTDAGEVICVIDALDECEEQSRQQFLDYLVDLYSSQKLFASSTICIKFLVTSRPYDDLESKFVDLAGHSSYFRFDGDDKSEQISREVNLVIDAKVKVFARSFKEEDQRRIAERLKAMEHHTYLWLFLTIDIIERSRAKYAKLSSIESLLADVPQQVFDAYEKLLSRSPDERKAKILLQIIVGASEAPTIWLANRMLTLATQTPKAQTLEMLDLWPENEFLSTVKNICGLLVTVHDGRLSLLHQTAREFLISSQERASSRVKDQWKGCIVLASAHSLLCQVCVDYLTLPDFVKPPTRSRITMEGASDNSSIENGSVDDREWESASESSCGEFSCDEINQIYLEGLIEDESFNSESYIPELREDMMLNYAAVYWSHHYRYQDEKQRSHLQNAVGPLFDATGEYFRLWVGLYNSYYRLEGNVGSKWNKSQTATFFNFVDLVEKYLDEGEAVDARSLISSRRDLSRTVLLIASEQGHTEAARLLLERGADPTIQLCMNVNAVTLASGNGHNEMLQLLFDVGIHVDWQSYEALTALQTTVIQGQVDTSLFLISKGADMHVRNWWTESALSNACFMDDVRILKHMIDSGADLKAVSNDAQPLLDVAIDWGLTEVTEILLSNGFSLQDYRGRYGSALQAASTDFPKLKLAQTLLKHDVDVNAAGGKYSSALNAACSRHGNLAIVQTLVQHGADVNPDSEGLMTPLHYASKALDAEMISYLLEKGANIEAHHIMYGTPLQIACHPNYGSPEHIVKLLLESGSNVNASGGSFGTALQQVCRHWTFERWRVAEVLIRGGANVNARASMFGNPLHCAVKMRNHDMAELLKLHGAVETEGDEPSCCNALQKIIDDASSESEYSSD